MKFVNKIKIYYLIFAVGIFSLLVVGATYAYWAAVRTSGNVILTNSKSYNISMNVVPLYHGFSFIPMNNEDLLKGVSKKCKDKYNRGACSSYLIKAFNYSSVNSISGVINANSNIQGLSYALLVPYNDKNEDENVSDECTDIDISVTDSPDIKKFCLYKGYNKFVFNEDQSLIDSYSVGNSSEMDFILVIWLENDKDRSQNDDGIGSFNASVTLSTGDGSRVEGVISDALDVEAP